MRTAITILASILAISVYSVHAGQLAALPYSGARGYGQSPAAVWDAVQEVADTWELKSATNDETSQVLVTEWKPFSDFEGSSFFQSLPTLPADGVQSVPIDFQLHVFVSPFVEPTRVYVGTVLRTEFEQNEYVHHDVGFVGTEFFREVETRLGAAGVTISVDRARGSPCIAAGESGSPSTRPVDLALVRRLADFEFFYPASQSEALVLLEITIGFDGAVSGSRVVSVNGPEPVEAGVFAQAAENIVSLWRYRPAERDGCAVSVTATVAMSFGLTDSRRQFYSQSLAERELGAGPIAPVSRVYAIDDDGVRSPRLLEEATPHYTRPAQGQQIEGEVWLDAVVLPDGRVGDIRVTRSLDMKFGLDVAAVIAAKQWRFDPGTRDGEPVAVHVGIALEFRLE